MWFNKYEEARFISHLDLNRYMPRAIRRSKFPVWYTEGYNKHLYINFAVPLSLGYESRNDCFEIKIEDDSCADSVVLERLKTAMPRGIEIYKVSTPVDTYKQICFAEYDILLDLPFSFAQMIIEIFSRGEITVMKKSKSGVKPFDLSEKVFNLKISDFSGQIKITVDLPSGCIENVNPSLLVQAIQNEFNDEIDYIKIVRNGFKTKDFTDFK